MKILIVDDQYEKVPEIARIATSINPDASIDHRTTAAAGRVAMYNGRYDLLIVDLHLPATNGALGTETGGIDFLNIVKLDKRTQLPAQALFLTAKEDLHLKLEGLAFATGAQICFFSPHKTQWIEVLAGRIAYVKEYTKRLNNGIGEVDVAIVTALRNPELQAVLTLPYSFKSINLSDDPTSYHIGRIVTDDGNLSVLAMSSFRKGMSSAASLASKITSKFKPRLLIMTGICAGVRGKVNLGDVIIGDPTWDWGSGKHSKGEDGSPVFKLAPHQCVTNSIISELSKDLSANKDLLSSIRSNWHGDVPSGTLSIHVGPMASGGAVIADDRVTSEIIDQNKDILAVDMEAYAVMAAAEYSNNSLTLPIVIKSVCDYADAEKNDKWQSYAAYTSAAFANALITELIKSGRI